MKSRVRIIKRDQNGPQSLPAGREEKTAGQGERAMVSIVKGWVAEWEQRKRLDAQTAFALVK